MSAPECEECGECPATCIVKIDGLPEPVCDECAAYLTHHFGNLVARVGEQPNR